MSASHGGLLTRVCDYQWMARSAACKRICLYPLILRIYFKQKVQVAESTHCTCATFADSDSLVIGSSDCTVRLWQITRKNDTTKMTETHIMRAHTESVLCVTSSRAWFMIVSGSGDGTAVIWDLNRAAYVRSISHRFGREDGLKVHLVAINESTVSRSFEADAFKFSVLKYHLWIGIYSYLLSTISMLTHNQCSPHYPTRSHLTFNISNRGYYHVSCLSRAGVL